MIKHLTIITLALSITGCIEDHERDGYAALMGQPAANVVDTYGSPQIVREEANKRLLKYTCRQQEQQPRVLHEATFTVVADRVVDVKVGHYCNPSLV